MELKVYYERSIDMYLVANRIRSMELKVHCKDQGLGLGQGRRNPFNGIERFLEKHNIKVNDSLMRIRSMELKETNIDAVRQLAAPLVENPFNGIERGRGSSR